MMRMIELTVSKRVTLRVAIPDDLPLVDADADQLRQMIVNLVSNASDAIGDTNGVIHKGRLTGTEPAESAGYCTRPTRLRHRGRPEEEDGSMARTGPLGMVTLAVSV